VEELAAARGKPVLSSEGKRIGDLDEIYFDDASREPEWLAIGTGFISTKRVVVPVAGAHLSEDGFHLPFTKEQVESSPAVDGEHIDNAKAAELFRYYGIEPPAHAPSEAETQAMPVADEAPAAGPQAVTRHEEELVVGKRPVVAGSVRLRKWVETEPVAVDLALDRETVHVRREAINETVEGVELGAQELEVSLQAEEPVVEKHTVARERVVLEKDVATEHRTIEDELRKERVEVDGDDGLGGAA
jgi:uncharacterized protein (TIGR02271 family)